PRLRGRSGLTPFPVTTLFRSILGQRGLAKIKEAISIVKQNRPGALLRDMEEVEVFKEDPKINRLLSEGRAIGAYYVESPAMRGLDRKSTRLNSSHVKISYAVF